MPTAKLTFVALVMSWCTVAFAQNKQFTGRVTNPQQSPLAGVTVQIKNSKVTTATAADGRFSITAPGDKVMLVFSSVGFEKKEILATAGMPLELQLKEEAQGLSDVVVIGYGTQRKTELTGAVSSIRSDKLREMPVVSVEQAVSGRLAGVQVQQTSGQPGAGISVRVRGVSSIAGGNEPLYVIDGLPQFNDDVRGANGLATINPSDIESIEVLKDASATAIYGSRGANGVVMVTTRSGRSGQARVVFESSAGMQKIRRKLELMNADEYVDFSKRYYTNSGIAFPADLAAYTPGVNEVNTDWQDEVFRTALLTNNNLSISGGNEKTRYYISTGYTNQQGIVRNSGYQRGSLRLNLESKVSDIFTIQSRLTVSRAKQNGFSPSVGDNTRNLGKSGIGSVLRAISTVPIKNPDGTYSDVTPFSFNGIDAENPVAMAIEVLDQNTTTRIQGGVDLKVTIAQGLTNTTRLSADFYSIRRDLYFPRILPRLGNNIGSAELGNYDKTSLLAEDFLEYKYNLTPASYLEAIGGVSYQKERLNTIDLAAAGFGTDQLKN
ncbi:MULTISPECIES: SusC/RagA family TonB-linked outer membrane protein [Niastella]|uniref:SusC/RagA family TonB-linked outer membrane protein n=1 Tax=Niastella soli TaxID=2821487 RepID=A0ABS3Z4W7_9BACT|nr:SusC/RagA family TonB-linked outer membrane protein [Niastella soli]MBO9205215.1 SusC/RagA family TonB-linked outer membrane protein [Niastella soli]